MPTYTPAQEITNRHGIYTAAFPAYKVFIYGQEISQDVVEARVNYAGGSVERAAGGCSITLVNPNDKYTLNYVDIREIGRATNALQDITAAEIEDFMDTLNSELVWSEMLIESPEGDDLIGKETEYTEKYKEDLENMKKKYNEAKKVFEENVASSVNWGSIGGFAKRRVLERKLKYTVEINPKVSDTNVLTYDKKTVPHYPLSVGDCIFHPNDPIRIAFRDPYDPRIWYWMFSGFMDSFTENSGPNKDSMVTITATDVTKSARYAFVQENTGFMDEDQLENVANAGFLPQELFADFTILEVLEILFFGSSAFEQAMPDLVRSFVAQFTDEQLQAAIATSSLSPDSYSEKDAGALRSFYIKYLEEKRKNRVVGLNMPPIVSPRNIQFKRKSESLGVSAYFYGEVDENDLAVGEKIPNLKKWNDILYHQVKRDDLRDMCVDTSVYSSFDKNLSIEAVIDEIGMGMLGTTDASSNPYGETQTTAKFPVGYGRVFYLAPGKLNTEIGRKVIDKSMIGSRGMHSIFRDKLSYLYDAVEGMDFRFYATPKGDIVLEMPFYDFDVDYFVYGDSGNPYSSHDTTDLYGRVEEFYEKYNDLFQKSYDGKYQGVADELSKMLFNIESALADLEAYDYNSTPKPDYAKLFTIEEHETISFSNTKTDQGVITSYHCVPRIAGGFKSLQRDDAVDRVIADCWELKPMLGERRGEGAVFGFIDNAEAAEVYAALQLNRMNAEAHNLSIQTLPNFGLMVNRPIFWRYRCCQANIVSLQHSIVWNNSCDTTINVNQIRSWRGEVNDEGMPIFKHFGGDRPFDLSRLLQQSTTNQNNNQGD